METIRLQNLADQCRRNNDYKSMAAVARVQQAKKNILSGRNITQTISHTQLPLSQLNSKLIPVQSRYGTLLSNE